MTVREKQEKEMEKVEVNVFEDQFLPRSTTLCKW